MAFSVLRPQPHDDPHHAGVGAGALGSSSFGDEGRATVPGTRLSIPLRSPGLT
jgi:hypothetical protein